MRESYKGLSRYVIQKNSDLIKRLRLTQLTYLKQKKHYMITLLSLAVNLEVMSLREIYPKSQKMSEEQTRSHAVSKTKNISSFIIKS